MSDKRIKSDSKLNPKESVEVEIIAAGVAHVFSNILLRIIGKAEQALNEHDSGKIHDHLNAIVESGMRARLVVRNLQLITDFGAIRQSMRLEDAITEATGLRITDPPFRQSLVECGAGHP